MAFNPLSGISGAVKVGVVFFAFGKWSLEMKNAPVKTNNFNNVTAGVGYQTVLPGVNSAELTLEALTYDVGNMPFVAGAYYTFTLYYSQTLNLYTTITILCTNVSVAPDYDGAQPVKVSGLSHGVCPVGIA